MSVETLAPLKALAALNGKMRRLSRRELELEQLESELNRRLDAMRGFYAGRMTALGNTITHMRQGIEEFCRRERTVLMNDGAKSLSTTYGKVGFRRTAAQVLLAREQDPEGASRELCSRDLAHLVRITQALDKGAIKRALSDGEVSNTLLTQCGIEVTDGQERFYCVMTQAAERPQ